MQTKRSAIISVIFASAILYSSLGNFTGFSSAFHGHEENSIACKSKCDETIKEGEQHTNKCKTEACSKPVPAIIPDEDRINEQHPVSILSFNFIFYIIYKFSVSELLGLSD